VGSLGLYKGAAFALSVNSELSRVRCHVTVVLYYCSMQ